MDYIVDNYDFDNYYFDLVQNFVDYYNYYFDFVNYYYFDLFDHYYLDLKYYYLYNQNLKHKMFQTNYYCSYYYSDYFGLNQEYHSNILII